MTNDLISFDINQIKVLPGDITFNGFEKLKTEALQLSEQITQVEVTEENVQVSKKMLAAVNKRVKEIDSKRISIKKELLEPYITFEQQVKEITAIVKDADNHVRQQVRDLEELERAAKWVEVHGMFEKRIRQYPFESIFTFDDFVKPKHLNKSTTMNSVEKDMVEWLENKNADFEVIQGLPNSYDVLIEYKDTKDLATAINNVRQRDEYKDRLKEAVPEKKKEVEKQFVIMLNDEKDYKLVEMFMEQNNINYKTQKGDY